MEGHKQPETQGPPNETSGGSPMAMGMGMAKRMMAQMGQGGSPFEMMQKMMAQMRSGQGKPPMEPLTSVCCRSASGGLVAP